MKKKFEDMFSCFDRIPACDLQGNLAVVNFSNWIKTESTYMAYISQDTIVDD